MQSAECLEQLLRAASDSAREQCVELVAFVIENIGNEASPQFALACLSALDAAVEHASFLVPEWTEESVQYLKSVCSVDLNQQFRSVVMTPIDETEDTGPFKDKFIQSSLALKILSRALLDNAEIFSANIADTVEICTMLSESIDPVCLDAACDSAALIAMAAQKHCAQGEELTCKLVEALTKMQFGKSSQPPLIVRAAKALRTILIVCRSPINAETLMQLLKCEHELICVLPGLMVSDDVVLLINGLVQLLVVSNFEELRAFAEEAMAQSSPENPFQYNAALVLYCAVIAAAPQLFDDGTKAEILQIQNEKIRTLETLYSPLFVRQIAEKDPVFFAPLAMASFQALIEAVGSYFADSEIGRKLMHYATVALMYIVLHTLPDCFTLETIDTILSVLPLKCQTGDFALETQFLIEVFQKSEGQFNAKILIIINEALLGSRAYLRKDELGADLISALKSVMKSIMDSDPAEAIAAICGESEALLENVSNFLDEGESEQRDENTALHEDAV